MLVLRDVISGAGLTQEAAARLFGVSQPRVSDLVRGKIHLFSLDTLVDMLTHAAIEVELSPIAPHGHTSSRAEGDSRTGASFAWTGTTAIAAEPQRHDEVDEQSTELELPVVGCST